MADLSKEPETEPAPSSASSLFDLRTVIAILFGSYGVLLLIIAIVDTPQQELDKSGGIHMNLWSGIVMLVVAAVFFAWMRLRPNN
jgi:drug/metabolite transporter (DMT)-like permease